MFMEICFSHRSAIVKSRMRGYPIGLDDSYMYLHWSPVRLYTIYVNVKDSDETAVAIDATDCVDGQSTKCI